MIEMYNDKYEKDMQMLFKEKYSGEKTEGFFTDCERIKSGEPLAYIIGFIPFLNTKIFLDSHSLIPRTETEYWVDKVLAEINKTKIETGVIRILDMCAGSGCIGVSVLKNIQNSKVDFAEIETRHHKTILKNIKENNLNLDRAKIIAGNLFENITETYDYILTNPPYIDSSIDRVEQSVKNYEPKIALYGGSGGLKYISKIIENAKQYLKPHGALFIEHEPEQEKQIYKLATQSCMKSESFPDQFGIIRYTCLS